jgi:iron complex transport system substrate-binding protein
MVILERQHLIAIAFSIVFLLSASCKYDAPIATQIVPSPCQIVQHAMGKTCIPLNPQRVVVWGGTELDPVLALGVKPIAGTPHVLTYVQKKLKRSQWEGIRNVDSPQGPNLELLLLLKPDLILGHQSRLGQVYSQLSNIAPTVLGAADDWKQTLWLFAQALGKTNQARRIVDDYEARIAEFRAKMGDRLPFTLASVEIRTDTLVIDTYDSFARTVIQEAGISLPQAISQYDWQSWILSQERLDELESDAIFVRSWGGTGAEQQTAKSQLEKLESDPLWQQLSVVRKNEVYEVGDYFQGGGPITANLILDDLFKYLTSDRA